MNINHRNILRHLRTQQDWTSSSQIAKSLGISKRSVKTYISEINSFEKGLIFPSKKGYLVNLDKIDSFLDKMKQALPQTPKERVEYLLKRLVNTNSPIKAYHLENELYISEMTLKSDLQKVKKRLFDHNLEMKVSRDMIELVGQEKNKRKLMSSILYNETEEKFFDIDLLKSFFEDYDIDYIRNVVVEIFSLHHYFTNDFSLANIVVHIAVAIERMKNGFIFTKQLNREPEIGKDYVMASEIAKKLEGKFDLEYTEEEIRDLSLLISSSGTSFNFMHLQLSDLQNIADIKCLNLVEKIFEDLQSSYDLTFGDSDFLIRFTLHIKNLLMRLENHYFSKNPLTATIKLTCPFIYDCAVHVSYTIKEVTGFTLNDDEIAYIAFHLGYTIELQKQSDSKITCSILFPFYYNYNVQLTEKLKSLFNEDLLIQHIVTNENELNALNSDLIISTIQLHSTPKIPYVVINPFFANGDQNKVTNKIKELKEIKKKNLFKQNLESITSEQLFQIVHSGGIKEEILEMMCKIMEEKKLVSPGFLSNVKERELMSSTAFGYMAIPHGIKMNANKTSMFTLINKKGIRWNDQIVNIIFLFAVSKDDKRIFHDIIDSLASILTEEKNVLEIMNATDFSTFVDMLVNAY